MTFYTAGWTRWRRVRSRRVGGFGRVGFPDGDETSPISTTSRGRSVAVSRGGGDGEGASRARARVREPVRRSPARHPLFEGRRGVDTCTRRCPTRWTLGAALGYVRVDLRTGETQKWWAGNRCFCEGGDRAQGRRARRGRDARRTREGECWILGMIADPPRGEGKSSLVILDGANLAAGPVAAFSRHRIPHGPTARSCAPSERRGECSLLI